MVASRLTLTHKAAQARVGSRTVSLLRPVWRMLDGSRLDDTAEAWLRTATAIIQDQRLVSARLAAAYLDAQKKQALGVGARAILADAAPLQALSTSLLVTGPISIKSAVARGVPLERAMSVAEARSSAAAMRHALNGGRETITGTLREDPQALGWERVTSGNPCDFCDMLAGRGAVYSADSADFQCHDGCLCTAEPVYR